MTFKLVAGFCMAIAMAPSALLAQAGKPADAVDYKVLATSKTSTMQSEMQAAASQGFRFAGVMGGETAFGGAEVVVVMTKDGAPARFQYELLATNKTSTMQKELQQAGDRGFEYRGQTVFSTTFGGKEVVVILEREDREMVRPKHEYKLLSTSKTSTLQKELSEAGGLGYSFVGMTVAKTSMGGNEVVAILRRER